MKWFSLFLLLSCSFPSLTQYDGREKEVKSRYRPGILWYNTGWRPASPDKARKYDRLMVDLTFNSWMSKGTFMGTLPGSIGFNVHGMTEYPLTKDNGMSLAVGLSFRHQHIRQHAILYRNEQQQSTEIAPATTVGKDITKSVFGSNAFAIPFEFRLRHRRWKQCKLHLGAYAGYRVSVFTKMSSPGGNFGKNRSFFDEERLFGGVHARLGVRNWALFVDYSPIKQFKSKESTVLYPVSVGVTLSVF